MSYTITPYTKRKAAALGVVVRPSSVKHKKIDVWSKDGAKRLASIGDNRYKDYPTYLREDGAAVAKQRRNAYHQRHRGDKGVAGKLAKALLW